MSEQAIEKDDQQIERGAAEDASGVPVTPTDIEASEKPPSEPRERGSADQDE